MGKPPEGFLRANLLLLQPLVESHERRLELMEQAIVMSHARPGAVRLPDGHYKLKPQYSFFYPPRQLHLEFDPPPEAISDHVRFMVEGNEIHYGVKPAESSMAKMVRDTSIDGEEAPSEHISFSPSMDWALVNRLLRRSSAPFPTHSTLLRLAKALYNQRKAEQDIFSLVSQREAVNAQWLDSQLQKIEELSTGIRSAYLDERAKRAMDTKFWMGGPSGRWPIASSDQAAVLWEDVSPGRRLERSRWVRDYVHLLSRTQYRPPLESRLPHWYAALRSLEEKESTLRAAPAAGQHDPALRAAPANGKNEPALASSATGHNSNSPLSINALWIGRLTYRLILYDKECDKLPALLAKPPGARGDYFFLHKFGKIRSDLMDAIRQGLFELSKSDVREHTGAARRMLILLAQDVSWTQMEDKPSARKRAEDGKPLLLSGERSLMARAAALWPSWPCAKTHDYLQVAARRRSDSARLRHALHPNGCSSVAKARRHELDRQLRESLLALRERAPIHAAVLYYEHTDAQSHVRFKCGPRKAFTTRQFLAPERLGETLAWFEAEGRPLPNSGRPVRPLLDALAAANARVWEALREMAGQAGLPFIHPMRAVRGCGEPALHFAERTLHQHRTDADWHKKRFTQPPVDVQVRITLPRLSATAAPMEWGVPGPVQWMESVPARPGASVDWLLARSGPQIDCQLGEARTSHEFLPILTALAPPHPNRDSLSEVQFGRRVQEEDLMAMAGAAHPDDYAAFFSYQLNQRRWLEHVSLVAGQGPDLHLLDQSRSPSLHKGLVVICDDKSLHAPPLLLGSARDWEILSKCVKRREQALQPDMMGALRFPVLERRLHALHGSKHWLQNEALEQIAAVLTKQALEHMTAARPAPWRLRRIGPPSYKMAKLIRVLQPQR